MLHKIFYWLQIWIDKCKGVDFARVYEDIPKNIGRRYQPSSPRILWNPKLKNIFREATEKDGILDVGCGKGRMLYYFSKYNFGKIDGLEYSHDLVCIARSNIYKLQLKCNVIEADAKTYDLLDGYNWFYMFNPFGEEVMKGFVKNLLSSVERKPRFIRVVYFNPRESGCFVSEGFKEECIYDYLRIYTLGKIDE